MLLHKQQHHPESANLLSYGHEFPLALRDCQSTASYIHKAVGYEQEHGALQTFVPNGVCNYLALEKSYCMSILCIPAFSPPELYSQRGGGGGKVHGHPGTLPSYASGKVLRLDLKARWYNESEKNSKYFLNLENRHC